MKIAELNYLNIGTRLTLSFFVLITLILGGNGLLIWQFQIARLQTDRLTAVNQQLIAVLRLQGSLMTFHQRLDELAESRDAQRLVAEAEPLRSGLLQQTERTRASLAALPPGGHIDPAFLPTLEAIEMTMPSQLEAIVALANSGDWNAVRMRVSNELKPLERQTSALVNNMDQEVSEELSQAVRNMAHVQGRIFLIVPITAISTFFTAAFFAWAITRRMIELRSKIRLSERMRIARELHDTLLQGLISAGMQLDIAVEQLPEESKPIFSRVLQIMGEVIEDGRNAVRGYRSGDRETQDLEHAFLSVPQELGVPEQVTCRVIVEGQTQPLHPLIRDEVYSIGREAMVNSFRHANPTQVEVELEYSADELRVLVRDDGSGINAQVIEFGRQGHWGLSGMRERAEKIGARLKILSRVGNGTEVELCVPAAVAFEGPSHPSALRWFANLQKRIAKSERSRNLEA